MTIHAFFVVKILPIADIRAERLNGEYDLSVSTNRRIKP